MRMFEHSEDDQNFRTVSKVMTNLEKGCLSFDISYSGKFLALGLGNGTVKLMNIN